MSKEIDEHIFKAAVGVLEHALEAFLGSTLEMKRSLMCLALKQSGAPGIASEPFKIAVGQYFAKQERLFLAEIEKVWPEEKAKP